jgi:pilus assembly protein CpaC
MKRCIWQASGAALVVCMELALAHGALAAELAAATTPAAAAKAAAPAAPAERADSGPRCSGEAARPGNMTLMMGKSNLMRLPEPVHHRSIGNPNVLQALLVAPDTLYLLGVDVGVTNMIIQGRSGACSVVDIVVAMDTSALQAALAQAMPDEKSIHVASAADALVLTGSVSDAPAAARAVELATAFVRQPLRSLLRKGDVAGEPVSGAAAPAGGKPELRVVNMLSVNAPQQVMLEVKIAEVSKSLLDRLDAGASLKGGWGSWMAKLTSNFLAGVAQGSLVLGKSNGNGVVLEAQNQDGLVRILAEPTVMAISGQEGSFLAGGKIFIPVAQDNNKITLEEREFGVGLRFTPTVLAGGRINLRVAPEVSELSREGIGISAAGFSGGAILPLITTRRASTTVQLYDGQSFAIGGLIKNNLVSNMKGLPLLSQVPVLGALFRSTDYQQDRTELVFVVTPHLVKPLAADYALPTDQLAAPTRTDVFLNGKLEATPPPSASPRDAAAGFEIK